MVRGKREMERLRSEGEREGGVSEEREREMEGCHMEGRERKRGQREGRWR